MSISTELDSLAGSKAPGRRDAGCAARSAAAGESFVGRAGVAQAWVLVEHPGPWPQDAPAGLLPAAVVDAAGVLAGRLRVLLIRRGRDRSVSAPLCVISWSDGTRHWMREGTLDGYSDLEDLDLARIADGVEPDFGVVRRRPLVAVCTHGKKDMCCAAFGRPILATLDALGEVDAWECTHTGGDRFAANMVVYPQGLFFSRLSASTAQEAIAAHRAGDLALPHFRGRSALPMPAQAAEHVVRERTGIARIDALEAADARPAGDGWEVRIRLEGREFRVALHLARQGEDLTHGCGVGRVAWNSWVVEEVVEVSEITENG
ncbi:sucrase ferredoxin [Tomitella biformata]|uniref:sucrase ferredoxin n=1 Tax=Tomitella biformata TaxID=630403 RepID=UPI000463E553|nr:sucrase ferredoxin [Tomitella biformata]